MKPFNLEAAMRGEPICDVEGELVKFVAYEPDAREGLGLVVLNKKGGIDVYFSDGRYLGSKTSRLDLRMVSAEVTVWVNVYPGGLATSWPTQKKADKNADSDRMGGCAHPIKIKV